MKTYNVRARYIFSVYNQHEVIIMFRIWYHVVLYVAAFISKTDCNTFVKQKGV